MITICNHTTCMLFLWNTKEDFLKIPYNENNIGPFTFIVWTKTVKPVFKISYMYSKDTKYAYLLSSCIVLPDKVEGE